MKINKLNEAMFYRLQEINNKKYRFTSKSPTEQNFGKNVNSPVFTSGSLNFGANKRAADRMDAENVKIAKRLLQQRP